MSVLSSVRFERQSWTDRATESVAFRSSWLFNGARAPICGPNCLDACLEF